MEITTKTNGYNATDLQPMIAKFEKAVNKLFPDCTINHFYYGDSCDMAIVILNEKEYADFNIYKTRISLCGYTCMHETLANFEKLTYRDECFKGQLMELCN